MPSNDESDRRKPPEPWVWTRYAKTYDPIRCGSRDGTETVEPHDRAVVRALNATYKPNKFVKGKPSHTLFVKGLSTRTTKTTIMEYFSKYGKLRRFRLVRDIVTGMPKGYAFIEYEHEKDAETAYYRACNDTLDGRVIFVDFECERTLPGWKPRRLGGGFGGKKEAGQLRFGGRERPYKEPPPPPPPPPASKKDGEKDNKRRSRSTDKERSGSRSSRDRDQRRTSKRRSRSREKDSSAERRSHGKSNRSRNMSRTSPDNSKRPREPQRSSTRSEDSYSRKTLDRSDRRSRRNSRSRSRSSSRSRRRKDR